MSDRYHSLAVVLEKDIRDDDAQDIIKAIQMIKGVLDVTGCVSDFDSHMAFIRARSELGKKIIEVVYPPDVKAKE